MEATAAERSTPPSTSPALLDRVPGLIWTVDRELRFASFDGAEAEARGSRRLVGQRISEFFPEHSEAVAAHREALDGNPTRYVLTAGGRSWSVNVAPFHDADGAVVGCTGVAISAPSAQARELELEEARETLRVLAESVPVVVYSTAIGDEERPRYVSSGIEELVGVPAPEFTFYNLREAIHPQDRAHAVAAFERADSEGADLTLEYRVVRPDGTVRWVEDSSRVVRVAGDLLAQGYLLDVTERKRAEAVLHRRIRTRRSLVDVGRRAVAGATVAELLHSVLAVLRDGIDADYGAYLELEGGQLVVRDCFGWSCVGAIASDVSPAARAATERAPVVTNDYEAPEGTARALVGVRSSIAAPIVVDDRVHGVFAVHGQAADRFDATDVDLVEHAASLVAAAVSRQLAEQERQAMEEQLLHAHRLDAVGQLAAGIAHDFNNLLTAVSGYAELAQRSVDDARVAGYLGEVLAASGRARDLTAQLLAFSRKQRLEPVRLDANELVSRARPVLTALLGRAVRLDLALCEGPLELVADPSRLENVLVNLAANARDAMPAGGRLVVSTSRIELDAAEAAEEEVAPGRFATIAVRDDGIGIPAELLGRIFEPFFTTKAVGEGTGLGLASVYGTVRQSGGFVRVRSEVGAGAEFLLGFPAA